MKTYSDVREILQDFVRINTCQPEGNEKALTDLVQEMFAPHSADTAIREIRHSKNRSSLIVRLGPDVPGGIAFVGHLDTVSVGDRDKWTYDPHAAELVDGKIYGRGTCDMKGGVAAMTAAALEYLETGFSFKKPLYLVYTADEEKGSMGVNSAIESGFLQDVDAFMVPEPTDNKIAIAEKGALWVRIILEGKLAHGSKPEVGINAVEAAIDLSKKIKKSMPVLERHKLLGDFTCSITKLEGGIMTNVIPAEAVVEIDIRTLPGQDHDDLLDIVDTCIREVSETYPGLGSGMKTLKNFISVEAKEDSDFSRKVQSFCREEELPDSFCGMSYYTDVADLVRAYPKPFLIMGPGHESMAHQLNEAVEVESLHKAVAVYKKLIKEYTGS